MAKRLTLQLTEAYLRKKDFTVLFCKIEKALLEGQEVFILPPGFKIEIGKRYLRRDGKISGPICKNPLTHRDYPFLDPETEERYAHEGWRYASHMPSGLDLMNEVPTPTKKVKKAKK
jgi:hypothetical protein